jgi:cell division protein FtsL
LFARGSFFFNPSLAREPLTCIHIIQDDSNYPSPLAHHHPIFLYIKKNLDQSAREVLMKKKPFLAVFIGVHLCFVVLLIHKSSRFVQESYRTQQCESTTKQLELEKQTLLCKLNAAQSKTAIKAFAQQKLGMKPIAINQIHKL